MRRVARNITFALWCAVLPLVFSAGPASASAPFSTFLALDRSLQGVGHDAFGNIYVVGATSEGPIQGPSIVAARLDPSGATAAYFVYIGAASPSALAVDAQGNAYITGNAEAGFSVTSGFSGPVQSGVSPFVLKLNPKGETVYATLFAGAVPAVPKAIAVDSAGDVIVTGLARSGYPVTPGTISAGDSGKTTDPAPFVTKLDPTGTKILFSAVGVGGSQVVLGAQGDIFLAGNTTSNAYPTTPGAFQATFTPSSMCGSEGLCLPSQVQYITRLSADGTRLIYSTFLTGSRNAINSGLAVDIAGNAYATGTTTSNDYPFTTTSAGDRPGLFLSKLDPTGTKLVWSVQQGGSVLTLDAAGNPVVGGSFVPATRPPVYDPGAVFPPPPPTGAMPAQCLPNRTTVQSIAYVQSFSAQDGSTAATQLLTASQARATGITVEPDGRIVLGGDTKFPDVPLSPGVLFSASAAQRTASGGFLAAFDISQPLSGSQLGCVVDSATLFPVGPVAPGQLISLFGSEIGPPTGLIGLGQSPLPTSLGNVQVTFDNRPAPLLYVSSGQVNVQVPYAISLQDYTVMTISVDSKPVATRMFAVTRSSPSVFLDLSVVPKSCGPLPDGDVVFAAVALNSDGSPNSCSNPAKPGSVVTLFLNGVPPPSGNQVSVSSGKMSLAGGPVVPVPGTDGATQLPIQLPEATGAGSKAIELKVAIDGLPAAPFNYSGGVFQTAVLVWMEE